LIKKFQKNQKIKIFLNWSDFFSTGQKPVKPVLARFLFCVNSFTKIAKNFFSTGPQTGYSFFKHGSPVEKNFFISR